MTSWKTLSGADRLDAFIRLTRIFSGMSEEQRARVRAEWPLGMTWEYPNPWRLACRTGERYSPKERMLAVLLYYAIAGAQGDTRDLVFSLGVVHSSAELAGIEPRVIFEQVARLAPNDIAGELIRFLERAPKDRSLEAFSLEVAVDEHGEPEVRRAARRC